MVGIDDHVAILHLRPRLSIVRFGIGSRAFRKAHHAPRRKIWALFVILSVPEKAIESPHSVRYQIVGLKKIEVLSGRQLQRIRHDVWVSIYTS